jgi:hypothetical protein
MDVFPLREQYRKQIDAVKKRFGEAHMKYTKWILAMTMAVTLLPGLASAQLTSSDKIVAQVPFDFMLAGKVVPAGELVIQWATADTRVLMLRNPESGLAVMSGTSQAELKQAPAHYALVFTRYESRYFLSGIKLAGDRTTYRLPVTKAEVEMRAQNGPGSEEVLLASLQ